MMEVLRSNFASCLLVFDGKTLPVREKLRSYHRLRRENQLEEAEGQARDALQFCRQVNDHVGMAMVRLHLALFYAEAGEIGQSVKYGEEAYRGFHQQINLAQRHNEALTTYALGLLYGLFPSSSGRALYWYQKTLQLLEGLKEYWATVDDEQYFDTCHRIRGWTEKQVDEITKHCGSQHSQYARVDVWEVASADTPFTKYEGYGYIIGDDQMLIGRTFYRAKPSIDIEEGNYHFALPVWEQEWQLSKSQVGDYVLVRQQWQVDEEKKGVVWESGRGWEAVDFTREDDEGIKFNSPNRKVIGGDPAGKLKGYIVADLKPISSAPQPSVSPSSTPPQSSAPPSSGPSYESRELFNELLSMVRGDRGVARRLIDYERRRAPFVSLSELIQRAIDRLVRDRR